MRKRFPGGLLAAASLCLALPTLGDVWDEGNDNDNGQGTDTELTHGLVQVHDLAAQGGGTIPDADWYRLQIPDKTSWEIVLDGMTGDVANAGSSPLLELIDSDGTTVIALADPLTSFGLARHLVTQNVIAPDYTYYVRVSAPVCGVTCAANDQYRIRAYDTTLSVPRFNNANGQITVLVLQNTGNSVVFGTGFGYGPGGTSLGAFSFSLQPKEVATFNLATINGGVFANETGGLRIENRAAYGQVTGKAVALEPATGFTFDTPVLPRPY